MKRVLFVASSGGHWIQLLRLVSQLETYERFYITTDAGHAKEVDDGKFFSVPEASRWDKVKLMWQSIKILYLVILIRPHVILTTGAAPGFFALFFGKIIGARTIWVDSIASADELSLSGRKVSKYADLWITQWEHLSKPEGPVYYGKVI